MKPTWAEKISDTALLYGATAETMISNALFERLRALQAAGAGEMDCAAGVDALAVRLHEYIDRTRVDLALYWANEQSGRR